MFYCPHETIVIFEFIHDITFLWVFAAVASMISPTAVLLNTCNHSSNSNILLSTMAVTDLLVGGLCVPLSAVVALLVSYQILTDHYICIACWTLLRYRPRLLLRFVRFSIWQWWHGKGTWPWLKSLMKKLAIIACSNCNCISNTLKYFRGWWRRTTGDFPHCSFIFVSPCPACYDQFFCHDVP